MKNSIYLDNSATKPLSAMMKSYLISMLDNWGNPSSLHSQGSNSKHVIQEARQNMMMLLLQLLISAKIHACTKHNRKCHFPMVKYLISCAG